MKKEIPAPDLGCSSLFTLPYWALRWEMLKTAIELNVFDHLTESNTAEQIAEALSTHPKNTEHFLNSLTALGCLSKENGRFKNTQLAQKFLINGEDMSIGGSLLFISNWTIPLLNGGLKDLVQNGPSSSEGLEDEEIWETGARATLNYSRCARAQLIAAQIASLPEFASFSRILDLGAGPGIMGIAVTAAHPSLRCFLFDRPTVCRVAEEVIAEYGLQDRVRTLHGDYMNDPIGENYDFIMANFTLNFYRERLDEIMDKVYRALHPNGIFMVTSDGLTDEKTQPAATVISWLAPALQGMDISLERGVLADAMLQTGFISTQSYYLPTTELEAHGPVDMVVGRKSKGK